MTKTQCILLGNLKDRYEELSGIKTTNDAVSCLGIYVGHTKTQCYKLNWIKIHEDMERLFESWKKKRKLTICGKTCVINSLTLILTYPNLFMLVQYNLYQKIV